MNNYLLVSRQCRHIYIEVKANTKVTEHDFRHIKTLSQSLGDKFHMGFVLYQGRGITPFGDNLFALPVDKLW